MIPVPQSALLPAQPLSVDLMTELTSYENNRYYIEAEAQMLHRLSAIGKMDRMFMSHCCDFSELESVYYTWKPGFETGLFYLSEKEENSMPISKNGKAYYTKDQYEAARYNSNALEYARSQGYPLVRDGVYYTMAEHDSMVFTPQGTWFWNSRGVHGTALEFQIYYEGKTLTEAILTLAGEQHLVNSQTAAPTEPTPTAPTQKMQAEPANALGFKMPRKADNYRLLFSYLCGARGLEKVVVQEMIRQGRLFQSVFYRPDGKPVFNATFVYRDGNGNAVGAFQRGMLDQDGVPAYKRDVGGSDKRYGWLLSGTEPTQVAVFEGAIDAASDASLAASKDPGTWQNCDRLSLEGLSSRPLENYLAAHPNIKDVVLMLDSDEAGRNAAREIVQKLQAQGYRVEDRVPPFGKDWNEVLIGYRSMQAEAQEMEDLQITPDEPDYA